MRLFEIRTDSHVRGSMPVARPCRPERRVDALRVLAARLEKLERAERKARRMALAAVCLSPVWLFPAAARGRMRAVSGSTVRAPVRVVDATGRLLLTIGDAAADRPVYGPAGRVVGVIKSAGPALRLFDPANPAPAPAVALSAAVEPETGGVSAVRLGRGTAGQTASLEAGDSSGDLRAGDYLGRTVDELTADRFPELAVFPETGDGSVTFDALDSGGYLRGSRFGLQRDFLLGGSNEGAYAVLFTGQRTGWARLWALRRPSVSFLAGEREVLKMYGGRDQGHFRAGGREMQAAKGPRSR